MRLLIIEDERDLVNALARGLRRQGYAVDIALHGQEGWEMAMVNEYDLLILDLNLPKMDGLEVCRRLRASKPDLLILMLTARDRLEDKVIGLDRIFSIFGGSSGRSLRGLRAGFPTVPACGSVRRPAAGAGAPATRLAGARTLAPMR